MMPDSDAGQFAFAYSHSVANLFLSRTLGRDTCTAGGFPRKLIIPKSSSRGGERNFRARFQRLLPRPSEIGARIAVCVDMVADVHTHGNLAVGVRRKCACSRGIHVRKLPGEITELYVMHAEAL